MKHAFGAVGAVIGAAGFAAHAGTPSAGEVCLEATPITCGSIFNYDNSLTSGGWDEIDLEFTTLQELLENNLCISNINEPNRNTYWFSFVPQVTSAIIDTCNSVGTDSSMQVYAGTCGNLVQVACSEDDCPVWNSRILLEGLTTGQTYYIQVGSWSGSAAGQYTMEIVCPAPDCAPCPTSDSRLLVDNDGPCQFVDYFEPGPLSAGYTGVGQNNNIGCWQEYQPVSAQWPDVPAMICGTAFHSVSAANPLDIEVDNDLYMLVPSDTNGLPTERLHVELTSSLPLTLWVRCDDCFCTQLLCECSTIQYSELSEPTSGCATLSATFDLPDDDLYLIEVFPRKYRPMFFCDTPFGILPHDIATKYTLKLWWDCVPCPDVETSDGTGLVDLSDLSLVLFHFGEVSAVPGIPGDADCDGDVDLDDLSAVLFAFGTTPGC